MKTSSLRIVKSIILIGYRLLVKIYFRLYSYQQIRIKNTIFLVAFKKSFQLSGEHTLKKYTAVSNIVANKLLDLPAQEADANIDDELIEKLYNICLYDETIKLAVGTFYLNQAYIYSSFKFNQELDPEYIESLEKAESHLGPLDPNYRKIIKNNYKTIKRLSKSLQKEAGKLSRNRIKQETSKLISPIKLRPSILIFAVTLFSTLFLLSGVIYNYIFYSHYGIDPSNFFTVSDYIATSVKSLVITTITTGISILFFLWGFANHAKESAIVNQLELNQPKNYVFPILTVLVFIKFILTAYQTNTIFNEYLLILVFMLFLTFLPIIPIWKYIENKSQVLALVIPVIYFSFHMGYTIYERIVDIDSGQFTSQYDLKFAQNYKMYSKYQFISANSNYAFLLGESNKIAIIPISAVLSFRPK